MPPGGGGLLMRKKSTSSCRHCNPGIHSKKEGKAYAGFNLPNSGAMIRFDSDRLSGINLVSLSHTFKVQINIYYMF